VAAVASTGPPPDYVCFAAQDWWYHNRAHSDVQLMLRVAEHRKVLLINSIGLRMPLPRRSAQPLRKVARKLRSTLKALRHPEPDLPNFAVFSPLVLPLYGSERGRRWNARLLRAQVRVALRLLKMTDPVYVLTLPTAWDTVRSMPRRSLIYNRSDRHSAFGEGDRAALRVMEESLLRAADHVLYVSTQLMDDERELAGDHGVFLDHGVDVEHFRHTDDEPEDLRTIPHPRLGFFGLLDDTLVDLDLLSTVAEALPHCQVVLIGDANCDLSRVTRHANVHWLGHRPYAEIPRYGSGFDVALMPWLDNEWIRYCNPIKLKEYLALGLPTVSTPFPELARFDGLVRVAPTGDDFVGEVKRVLEGDDYSSAAERRAAVVALTWERQADTLMELAEGRPRR